ncbi:MAG: hypothetical protein ABIP75_05510 [Pyrinomonadaceae bacterium]
MRNATVLGFLILLCLVQVAVGQDRDEVSPKNLPKGVSAAKARNLLAASELASERDQQAVHARRQRQLESINQITAGARAALKPILAADKTGTYQSYQAEIKRIGKLDAKEQGRALRGLDGKYLTFFQNAFKQAGIDEPELQAKISKVLPGAKFGALLTCSGQEPPEPEEEEAEPKAHAAQDTQTLSAPFGLRSTKRTTQGLSIQIASATADLESGDIRGSVDIVLGLGNGRATAAVGQAIEIPSGPHKVRSTVDTKTDYTLHAVSLALNGAAGAWADARIDVTKPNGTLRKKTQNLGWVVAPVLWFVTEDGDEEPLSLSKTVTVPGNAGGQFHVKARVITEAYTYGISGFGVGRISSTLQTIKMKTIP